MTQDRAHFAIEANGSLFTVQAFAAGIIAVVAHSPKFAIRDLDGEMTFVPGSMSNATIQLTINARSLEIMDEVNSLDRQEIERVMFDEVLETNRYPRIEYKSTHISASSTGQNMHRLNVAGDLTLHGSTRGVGLEAQVIAGDDTLRAQGAFTLQQSDYGLKIASVAGGTLKLKDELRFAYFIIGRRRE